MERCHVGRISQRDGFGASALVVEGDATGVEDDGSIIEVLL